MFSGLRAVIVGPQHFNSWCFLKLDSNWPATVHGYSLSSYLWKELIMVDIYGHMVMKFCHHSSWFRLNLLCREPLNFKNSLLPIQILWKVVKSHLITLKLWEIRLITFLNKKIFLHNMFWDFHITFTMSYFLSLILSTFEWSGSLNWIYNFSMLFGFLHFCLAFFILKCDKDLVVLLLPFVYLVS